jgi:Ca2+/Na+ antiporter
MKVILISVAYIVIALIVTGIMYHLRPFKHDFRSIEEENGCYVVAGCLFPVVVILLITYHVFLIPFKVVDRIHGRRK